MAFAAATICASALPVSAADDVFQQAVKAYNAKDYRGAYSKLEIVRKKTPNDVNALYYEALCCYQLRDFVGATVRYKLIVQISPYSTAAGLAQTALAVLDQNPAVTATVATKSDIEHTATAPSASQVVEAPAHDDMKGLPDQANFYFTKESGGHMLVTVMVNGHQVPALFDTGAGAFFYKDQLQAAGVDCNRAKPAGFTHGWAGTPVPIFSMDAEVKLGSLVRTIKINFEDSNTGLQKNLIGQTLIQGYQYEIDDKGGRVDLKKTIAQGQTNSLYDIPLRVENNRDILDIEINGRKVRTFIDTGAVCTVLDNATADACGIETTGSQRMTGVGGSFAVGLGTAKIRVGPISKDFTVHIGGSGGNCIGQDFMEGWRFKIDREHGLLRFFH